MRFYSRRFDPPSSYFRQISFSTITVSILCNSETPLIFPLENLKKIITVTQVHQWCEMSEKFFSVIYRIKCETSWPSNQRLYKILGCVFQVKRLPVVEIYDVPLYNTDRKN